MEPLQTTDLLLPEKQQYAIQQAPPGQEYALVKADWNKELTFEEILEYHPSIKEIIGHPLLLPSGTKRGKFVRILAPGVIALLTILVIVIPDWHVKHLIQPQQVQEQTLGIEPRAIEEEGLPLAIRQDINNLNKKIMDKNWPGAVEIADKILTNTKQLRQENETLFVRIVEILVAGQCQVAEHYDTLKRKEQFKKACDYYSENKVTEGASFQVEYSLIWANNELDSDEWAECETQLNRISNFRSRFRGDIQNDVDIDKKIRVMEIKTIKRSLHHFDESNSKHMDMFCILYERLSEWHQRDPASKDKDYLEARLWLYDKIYSMLPIWSLLPWDSETQICGRVFTESIVKKEMAETKGKLKEQ